MTSVKSQKGFTLVEIILFLALTGLIFLIGFVGIGGRNRQVQFTDSIRSIDSFVQSNLNDVFNGVNNAALVSDNNPDEVLLGKYFAFCSETNTHPRCAGGQGTRMLVYDVVGDKLSNGVIVDITTGTGSCPGLSTPSADIDVKLLDCSRPRVAGDPEVGTIEWGTNFISANAGVRREAVAGFSIMRSPNSSRVFHVMSWNCGACVGSVPGDNDFINLVESGSQMFYSGANSYDPSGSMNLCFRGYDNQYAAILIGFGERQTSFETIFDPRYNPSRTRSGQIPNTCGNF